MHSVENYRRWFDYEKDSHAKVSHSWYHRGQIATLVRALGAEPAVTDFVFWSRELVETNQNVGS